MSIFLDDLFPDEVTDEIAFHLVNFLLSLSEIIEARYSYQMERYIKNCIPDEVQQHSPPENSEKDPF